MAELILATDARGGYEDGDIIHAHNDLCMLWRHTQLVTDHRKERVGFWKSINGLAYKRLEATSQYKLERISKTKMRRTNLITLESEVLNHRPNGNGHSIDVQAYIELRLEEKKLPMFGDAQNAVWFTGRTNATLANLSDLWTSEITPQTGLLEQDHKQNKYSPHFLRRHLVIVTTDFSNARRAILDSPDMNETDEDNPIVISKRRYKVNWRDDLGISGSTVDDIDNRTKKSEVKRDITRTEKDITEAKTRV